MSRQANKWVETFVIPVLLFGVALVPRVFALDVFLTVDEYRWFGRSRDFLAGLITGDWGATLQTGHPGVTTMWTGSLAILYRYWTRQPSASDDLLTFVRQLSSEPLEVTNIAPMRLPTVLLTSIFVVVFYALVSRLFDDRRVGVVAALLLALDPHHIGLSRVLHQDALQTTFMLLSLLPLLGYWLKGWSRRWLLLSGVAAGLSFLSKASAVFLMPFFVLSGLAWALLRWRRKECRGWSDVRRLIMDSLLWGVVACLTIFLFWPAMWVMPLDVLKVVFGLGSQYFGEADDEGVFFLGRIAQNPGPLFYPVAWLLRTTPLIVIGLVVWVGISIRSVLDRRPEKRSSIRPVSDFLLIYVLLFVTFLTLADKKQDRYLLPIYPALAILAALGLVRAFTTRYQVPNGSNRVHIPLALIAVIIFLFQGILVKASYPYYFTYYNPLVGGARMATRLITVGWGEGLEQAAAYLNSLPDADQLAVTSWYHNSLSPFFRGQATNFTSEPGKTLGSDYAVLYRNQIQRELPTPEIVNYLLEHHTPDFTVTLREVDYVYVYRLPLARDSDWRVSRLPDQATLLGVAENELTSSQTGGREGTEIHSVPLRLYWQNDGLATGQQWWVALQPVDGQQQAWQICSLLPEFADERSTVGAVLESECRLAVERDPPDVYHLRIGVGPDPSQIRGVPFSEGEFAVAVLDDGMPHLVSKLDALDRLASSWLPQGAHPADLVYYGAVRLVGYTTQSISTEQGRKLQVQAYWQALEPLPVAELEQAVRIESVLLSPQETVLALTEGPIADAETWPEVWSPGQVLTTSFSLPLPVSVPPQSQLRLNVVLDNQRRSPLDSRGEAVEPSLPTFLIDQR
jgi:4-amino-4-deoxy-L-arabinose transferase-like glycosyltransferase